MAAYTRKIVVRTFIGERRRMRWRREKLTDAPPELPSGGEHIEDRLVVWQAMSVLGARQRAVLVLRFWHDLSVEETASALGCTTGTVKSQSARRGDAPPAPRTPVRRPVAGGVSPCVRTTWKSTFEQLRGVPMPVRALTADDIISSGEAVRKRRRTMAVVGSGVGTTVVVAAAVLVLALKPGAAPTAVSPPGRPAPLGARGCPGHTIHDSLVGRVASEGTPSHATTLTSTSPSMPPESTSAPVPTVTTTSTIGTTTVTTTGSPGTTFLEVTQTE